jgi:hypothetical protein
MLSGMLPRTLALLVTTVPAVVLAADVPRPPSRPVLVHDFETLSHADALRLVGKPARYQIVKDSRLEDYEGRTLIETPSPARPG